LVTLDHNTLVREQLDLRQSSVEFENVRKKGSDANIKRL
jgi:hypothetical protein